jgi:hypothetical protein
MTIKVEIIIDDPAQIAGVEYARDLYNKTSCPESSSKILLTVNPPIEKEVCKLLTSEEYILFVAKSAVESYATQAERAAKLKEAGIE